MIIDNFSFIDSSAIQFLNDSVITISPIGISFESISETFDLSFRNGEYLIQYDMSDNFITIRCSQTTCILIIAHNLAFVFKFIYFLSYHISKCDFTIIAHSFSSFRIIYEFEEFVLCSFVKQET